MGFVDAALQEAVGNKQIDSALKATLCPITELDKVVGTIVEQVINNETSSSTMAKSIKTTVDDQTEKVRVHTLLQNLVQDPDMKPEHLPVKVPSPAPLTLSFSSIEKETCEASPFQDVSPWVQEIEEVIFDDHLVLTCWLFSAPSSSRSNSSVESLLPC